MYLQMIYETALSHLFILVASAALVVAGVYALSLTINYYGIIMEAKEQGLDNKIVIYNHDNMTYPPDYEYALNFLERVRATDGVGEAEYLDSVGTFFMTDREFPNPMLMGYSALVNSGFEFDLIEGDEIDTENMNEVLISESASEYLSVGDEIRITLPSHGLIEGEGGINYIDVREVEDYGNTVCNN